MSFANSEFLPSLNRWVRPLLGHEPYNKKTVDEGMKANLKVMDALEQHLLLRTFLVGERITLADLVTAALVSRGFEHVSNAVNTTFSLRTVRLIFLSCRAGV